MNTTQPSQERNVSDEADAVVLTVAQTAKLLGISRGGAYALVARNELPHVRLGRRIVVPRAVLERFLEEISLRSSTSSYRPTARPSPATLRPTA